MMRKTITLLLSLMLILSLGISALAADASLIFRGARRGFEADPGSSYTATDLFDNF